jgi:hypothetical protein
MFITIHLPNDGTPMMTGVKINTHVGSVEKYIQDYICDRIGKANYTDCTASKNSIQTDSQNFISTKTDDVYYMYKAKDQSGWLSKVRVPVLEMILYAIPDGTRELEGTREHERPAGGNAVLQTFQSIQSFQSPLSLPFSSCIQELKEFEMSKLRKIIHSDL